MPQMISYAPDLQTAEKHVTATITFTGAANLGQAGTAATVFSITGRVLLTRFSAFCTTLLTEALATATVSAGTTSDVNKLIAVTNSVNIDANEWWTGATPAAGASNLISATTDPTAIEQTKVLLSEDIIVDCVTQDTNAGVIVFDAWYIPVTTDGALA